MFRYHAINIPLYLYIPLVAVQYIDRDVLDYYVPPKKRFVNVVFNMYFVDNKTILIIDKLHFEVFDFDSYINNCCF